MSRSESMTASPPWPSISRSLRNPSAYLSSAAATSVELIRRLRQGTLDVALIGLPSDTGELVVEPLHREPLVALVPVRHALARRKILSLDLIKDHPLFWPRRRMNPEKELWIGFGVAYKRGRSVPGMDVFLDLVRRKRRLQRRNEES